MDGAPPTILVTGGCGYLGSRLLRDLPEAFPGATVRILDNLQRETHHALMDLPEGGRYEFQEGDILDGGMLRRALRGVDAVVHLAAVVRTPMSFENPTWMQQVNHWGTAGLAEACLQAGVTRFVYASTTAVYGPGGPFTEADACRPIGPYATSKRQAEQAVLKAAERGLEPTVLRLGMLYGRAPAMRFDGVVNRFAFLAGTGRPLTVYGTGEQRRPVVHVADASRAVVHVLREVPGDPVLNVVEANPSVNEIVEGVKELKSGVRVAHADQDALTHLSFEAAQPRLQALRWRSENRFTTAMSEIWLPTSFFP